MFWVDVERIKQTTDKWILRRQVARILELYLHDGARFALCEEVRAKLLLLSEEESGEKRHKATRRVIKMLIRGQELIITRLKDYWCPRYKLHLEDVSQESHDSHPKEGNRQLLQCGDLGSSPWYKVGASILSISEQDKRKRRHKSDIYLPRIISDKGKDCIDVRPNRISHAMTSPCKLPELNENHRRQPSVNRVLENVTIGSGDVVHSLDSKMRTLQLLLSPSTLTLFPQSAESAVQHRKGVTSLVPRTTHLSPYLTASMRADFISGNPFLRHLKTTMYNSKAVNCLLFWQSVECILTQDEARRWYRRFEGSSSDQTCPYPSFLETYPVASNLKELLHLFVKDGAPHRIDLSMEIRKELCVLLPKGLGQSLILSAQEEATEVNEKLIGRLDG